MGIIIDDRIFISGDTKFNNNYLKGIYNKVEYIFQDCEFATYPNSVHAQFNELKYLDKNIKNKMYLYHYSLGNMTYYEANKIVEKAGFRGLVKPKGHKFIL